MKAVILAAGEGRRLEPLTEIRPKPMLPVANRPLLEHVVESVSAAGIDSIVLVVGYERERIQSYFGDGDDWGVDIEYAIQEKQLGTGHAVLQAEGAVSEPFMVLNGDRIIESSLVERVLDAEAEDETLLAVTRREDPVGFGVVETTGDRVTAIAEKPPRHEIASEVINAGVYRFDPAVFDAIRETETAGELAITDTLATLAEMGEVTALRYRGTWLDVSHLWDLITVNGSVLDGREGDLHETVRQEEASIARDAVAIDADARIGPGATIRPGTAIGENVRVGPTAVLDNAVVFPGATIEPGAILRDCVVAENARVGPNVTIEGGPADVVVDGTVHEDVGLGGVVGDNARLGGNVTVQPGTVIGAETTVAGGTKVDGRVPSGTQVR